MDEKESNFIGKAGDVLGKVAKTAGRTGKYGKLKASLVNNTRKQNELYTEIGRFVMANDSLREALSQIDSSFEGDLGDLLALRQDIQAQVDELKEQGLIPKDEEGEWEFAELEESSEVEDDPVEEQPQTEKGDE